MGTQLVTGREKILAQKSFLVELSNRYGQKGAMDHLEYFLSSEDSLKKNPHLLLIGNKEQGQRHIIAQDAIGALLIYEYRFLGIGTGIFSTDDTTGRRTLIAPPESRILIARLAAEALMKRGARVVMKTLLELASEDQVEVPNASTVRKDWIYATRHRPIPSYLQLETSMDATLAKIGQRTRSNMRYYRRRAEAQLGCFFVAKAEISHDDFKAFNLECAYAVPDERAAWRYEVVAQVPGMFLCGIKGSDGRWLSIIGGRRYHDMVEIDWQMNRADLPAYSLSTVMRSYFIEHEISLGTKKMYIEGGTPHAMQFSFAMEDVRDIVVVRGSWLLPILRVLSKRLLPETNFLSQILAEPEMSWQPWRSV